MKITVQRSGGVAGITRTWTVDATTPEQKKRWMPLVEACPWDQVQSRAVPGGQADRFVYSIRAGQRRATLPETSVTGPWQALVESAKAEGQESLRR